MSRRISFTEDMNEVTGFGGFYERCCRAAIVAGTEWWLKHRDEPFNPEKLQRAIFEALVARDNGTKARLGEELTATQMAVILHHLRYIATHGWSAYRKCMSEAPKIYHEGAA